MISASGTRRTNRGLRKNTEFASFHTSALAASPNPSRILSKSYVSDDCTDVHWTCWQRLVYEETAGGRSQIDPLASRVFLQDLALKRLASFEQP